MRQRLVEDQRGFTLAEVLVTMVVMLTVMFALYSIFDMSLRVFSFGNDKTEAVQNARLGMERMGREIRAAYPYDKPGGNDTLFPGYSANPSDQITFGNELNGNRKIAGDEPTEEISYEIYTTGDGARALGRAKHDGNNEPVVEFIKSGSLEFTYLEGDGTEADSESAIEIVRIRLEIEVERGPQAGTQKLTTEVALRNRSE